MAEFRAIGRIPLKQGWKEAFGAADGEAARDKDGEAEAEQTMPPLVDGQTATLTNPRVQAKETQPPPRYNEGTLVDAMQNAWRFIEDETLRERLKEAKGIGTPATRAEIIKGLKRQNLLTADGKLVVPTPAGLQLFELLRRAAPALVDPGTTAVWEMRLDDVVMGKADFRTVIDEIAGEAERLISILRKHNGATVELEQVSSARTRHGTGRSERTGRMQRKQPSSAVTAKSKSRRPRNPKTATPRPAKEEIKKPMRPTTRSSARTSARSSAVTRSQAPTAAMISFAERLARDKRIAPPSRYDQDFDTCRRFLDEHSEN